MFRRFLLLLSCLFFSTSYAGSAVHYSSNCLEGNGTFAEKARNIKGYESIVVQGAFTVLVSLGDDYRCTIGGDANLLSHIVTRVENRELQIDTDRSLCMMQPLVITLQVPRLDRFYADGSHDIRLSGLTGQRFEFELQGANAARLSGTVEHLIGEVHGTSEMDAFDLKADLVTIHASGTASAKVQALQQLEVSASGVTDVSYQGKPQQIRTHLDDLATVHPAGS
ncbi:MAG: DUF2807 domain-containing protein [Desulfuromonadaceae bacterium]|nr:DUF2807 domain-containing protein [Desulfuromonadaceae bacterium]